MKRALSICLSIALLFSVFSVFSTTVKASGENLPEDIVPTVFETEANVKNNEFEFNINLKAGVEKLQGTVIRVEYDVNKLSCVSGGPVMDIATEYEKVPGLYEADMLSDGSGYGIAFFNMNGYSIGEQSSEFMNFVLEITDETAVSVPVKIYCNEYLDETNSILSGDKTLIAEYTIVNNCTSDIEGALTIDHDVSEDVIVKEATCTEDGLAQGVCGMCSEAFDKVLYATGHSESDWIVDAEVTCTGNGSKHQECTVCGEILDTKVISSSGHSYGEWENVNDPTCTTTGSKTKTCSACGDVKTETIPVTDHDYSTEWIIDVPATCGESGSKSRHCSVCGDKTDITEILPFGDHEYGDWTLEKDYTCTEDGSVIKTCSVCGDVKRATGAEADFEFVVDSSLYPESSHDYDNDISTTYTFVEESATKLSVTFSENTYMEDGCDYIEIYEGNDEYIGSYTGSELAGETVEIQGNSFKIMLISDGSVTEYGFSIDSIVATKSLKASHRYEEQVVKEATFDKPGESIFTCSVCGDVQTKILPALYNDHLTLTLNDDETAYIITDCYGGVSGDITLPAEHNGLPIKEIGSSAFSYCSKLEAVVIPEGIERIGYYAFYNCESTTYVEIPSSITYVGVDAFCYCPAESVVINSDYVINNIDFSDFGVYSDWSEAYELSLETLIIGKDVTEINVSLQVYTFDDFARRQRVLTEIIVDEKNEFYSSQDGVLYNKDMTELVCYPCGKTGSFEIPESVTSLAENSFSFCNIDALTFSSGLKNIDTKAFYVDDEYYSSIVECVVANNNYVASYDFSENIYEIQTLELRAGVTEVDAEVLHWNGYSDIIVAEDNDCFTAQDGVLLNKDATKLIWCRSESKRDYTLHDTVRVIGSNAFYYECGDLTFSDSVEKIEPDAFYGVSSFENLYIPDLESWLSIDFGNEYSNPMSLSEKIYIDNETLTKLDIPEGTESVGAYAFCGCGDITEVIFPKTLNNIGMYAFYGCEGLGSVTIPGNVKTIDKAAFMGATSLSEVILCPGVEKIGNYAFYENASRPDKAVLTRILIPVTVTELSRYAFSNVETIVGAEGSYAQEYAEKLVYDFEICDHKKDEHCKCILCGDDLSKEGLLVSAHEATIVIDEENNVVFTTRNEIDTITGMFDTAENVNVTIESDVKTSLYGTGSIVSVYENGEKVAEYVFVVKGDIDGDGACDVLDAVLTQRMMNGYADYSKAQAYAANGEAVSEITVVSYQRVINSVLAK